jgi:hypothetical protein
MFLNKVFIHELLRQPVCEFYSNFSKRWDDESCFACSYKDFCTRCLARIYAVNIQRIKDGNNLCEIVKRNKMDDFFDFNSNFKYLIYD